MKYEEAIKVWGATKIATTYAGTKIETIDLETVEVKFDFNPGMQCCGGSNPECYCSMAEAPTANVIITATRKGSKKNGRIILHIDLKMFDFSTTLKEICEAGDGIVTL